MRANPNDSLTIPRGFVKAGESILVRTGFIIWGSIEEDDTAARVADELGALLRPEVTNLFVDQSGQGLVLLERVQYTSSIENVEATLASISGQLEWARVQAFARPVNS